MTEVVYKMFEQLRLLNDDMVQHLKIQKTKKDAVEKFESVLLKE